MTVGHFFTFISATPNGDGRRRQMQTTYTNAYGLMHHNGCEISAVGIYDTKRCYIGVGGVAENSTESGERHLYDSSIQGWCVFLL